MKVELYYQVGENREEACKSYRSAAAFYKATGVSKADLFERMTLDGKEQEITHISFTQTCIMVYAERPIYSKW